MARFRPSRLFRRFSSRSDTNPRNTSPSPPPSSGLPSPTLPAYSVPTPQRVRKSSSLPKLGKRSTVRQATPEVPEAVKEQRESLHLSPLVRDEAESPSQRSGSETLNGEKESEIAGLEVEEEKTPEISEEELRLEQVDSLSKEVESLRKHPTVVVQQPTPDLVQEVKRLEQHGPSPLLQQTDSGEVTLAPSSPTADEVFIPKEEPFQPAAASADRSRSVSPTAPEPTKPNRPTESHVRRPSIVDSANARIVKTLIDVPSKSLGLPSTGSAPPTSGLELFSPSLQNMAAMLHRKIWVKRPGASATLVQIREDDLVDDVRDMILRKYANSLGRTFDAPDMTLHIVTRAEHGNARQERMLGPEEEMCRTIDSYYSGGQNVDEALIINVPQRRTPKPSPRVFHNANYSSMDEYRPLENGTDYFPPMPAVIPTTIPQTAGSHDSRSSHHHHNVVAQQQAPTDHPRSISVLNTGQIPPLPSPGAQSRRHQHRPKYQRQPTSSPTIISHPAASASTVNLPVVNPQQHLVHRQSARPRLDSSASEHPRPNGIPVPPPLPSPAAPEAPPTNKDTSQPPTPSAGAPIGTHPHRLSRPKKPRKATPEDQVASTSRNNRRKKDTSSSTSPHPGTSGMLDASVPPINVLIVEDNIINLRILEGLMKRLKVRWQTAMNGQIAVDKWRNGGFHLVLMDIQMPVMSGLQATKEIRRLERVNGIGVFSSTSPDDEEGPNGETTHGGQNASPEKGKKPESDRLQGTSEGLFKSPVIIVALTASSLQSDRHEALAAGCNDFLTKPVNFVWLERKVKEWGCMQALIDFDGWRKWKDYAEKAEAGKTEEEKQKEREKEEKDKIKAEKMAKLQEKQAKLKEERDRKKRLSSNAHAIEEEAVVDGGPSNGVVSNSRVSPGTIGKEKDGGGDVNGLTKLPSATLKPGAAVLGEVGLDLA